MDRALIQLAYLFHDLARIDPIAQYFVAMATSVLRDKREVARDPGQGRSSLQ